MNLGSLTLNTARFCLEDENLGISMNLRIPIHTNISYIKKVFNNLVKNKCILFYFYFEKDSQYIPKQNKLV